MHTPCLGKVPHWDHGQITLNGKNQVPVDLSVKRFH